MKQKKFIALLLLTLTLCACSNSNKEGETKQSFADMASGNMDEYVNSDVNAIVQALPQIIVIPSDQVLDNNFCFSEKTLDGKSYKTRNYKDYFNISSI